jgi:hypothetical protein
MVGARQREEADLVESRCGQSLFDHLTDTGDGSLANRAGDHAGLAETAAPGAAAEDLDRTSARARFQASGTSGFFG